ncbi:hypothetical protein LJC47_00045 [Desulfosarcina sp. OttesenSCG-928-B08]|nr:hypothetical protein [Desulfosarcina sp. OttesenSCG-928-B08]
MKVRFEPRTHPVWGVASTLEKGSPEGMFSAERLAACLSISSEKTLSYLEQLRDQDIVIQNQDHEDEIKRENAASARCWCLKPHCLIEGKEYDVLSIEYDDYRILHEPTRFCGPEPTLFPRDLFVITDPEKHSLWICKTDEDGCIDYTFFPWHRPGFWEDFFDGVKAVVDRFFSDLKRYFPETARWYETWKKTQY